MSQNLSVPNVIWLVGKGPSVDIYDWAKAGYTVALNESALVVPCDAAFAIDYDALDTLRDKMDANILMFKKESHRRYEFKKEYKYKFVDPKIFKMRYTVATVAIYLMYELGVRTIHFVGFDSIDGNRTHAESIKPLYSYNPDYSTYIWISEEVLRLVNELEIKAIWEHRT